MNKTDIKILGQQLLANGFKTWFLFMFKVVEKQDFIIEPVHNDMFDTLEKVSNLETTRLIMNVFPRIGKTTLATYFIAYHITLNSFCNFIYTSYSIELLNSCFERLKLILTNDLYINMYFNEYMSKEDYALPLDEFWKEERKGQLTKEKEQFYFRNRYIKTSSGGTIYFNSIGSQITGFGFGSRIENNKFNGCLFIDDPQAPKYITSKKMMTKTNEYFDLVLLSRANSSNAPIIIEQQRISQNDLTGYIQDKYVNRYTILKLKLVNEKGEIQAPRQYTRLRIEELKINNFLFQSQYQQEPILSGGNIIKSEWFKNYDMLPRLKQCYIVGDTAFKTGQENDYSVFQLWGRDNYSNDANYYLIDMIRGKWESPELLNNLLNFYEKHKKQYIISSLYIEDKASGQGLIQQIKRLSIPVKPIQKNKDKYTCLMDVLPRIASGYVYLPTIAPWKSDFINECSNFRQDLSQEHDDQVDCLTMALSTQATNYSIKNIL